MPVYFLLPELYGFGQAGLSGGALSNFLLACDMGKQTDLHVAPITGGSVYERPVDPSLPFSVTPPHFRSRSRFTYFLERSIFYKKRVKRLIAGNAKGSLIATRSAIPYACSLSRRYGLSLAIVCRAYEDLEQAGIRGYSDRVSIYRKLDGSFNRLAIRQAYRRANVIVTNSVFMKNQIEEGFQTSSPIHVLPPKMDLARRVPGSTSVDKIGFFNKGLRKGGQLIDEISARMPDKTFLIYGEPLDCSPGAGNIEQKGYEADREHLFAGSDLFLLPSMWDEPFGRVAAEALWSGKPVLASKRGGLPEAAPDPFFQVQGFDADEWVARIRYLENNIETCNHHIREAQKKLQRTVSPEAHKQGVRELLEQLHT